MQFLFLPWDVAGIKRLLPSLKAKKMTKPKLQAIVTPWVLGNELPMKPSVKLFDMSESDIYYRACSLWEATFDPKCKYYCYTFADLKFTKVTDEYYDCGDYMITDGDQFLFFTLLEEEK